MCSKIGWYQDNIGLKYVTSVKFLILNEPEKMYLFD